MKIKDFAIVKRGSSPRPIIEFLSEEGYPWLKISDFVLGQRYIYKTKEFIKPSGLSSTRYVQKNTLIITNSASPGIPIFLGEDMCLHDGFLYFEKIDDYIIPMYLYYYFLANRAKLVKQGNGSVFVNLKKEIVENTEINIPTIEIQQHIVNTIGSVDELIEINNQKISKLKELIDLEYRKLDIYSFDVSTLESEFNISIGRTPPRNEKEWFTVNNNDMLWVSIKDMGEKELFIYDTNEKLIPRAIDRFNYVVANENDILMSFKLTVGKVSIAGKNLVTNEAIATFKPKKDYLRWFLYCYLNACDFTNAGSTSSIATAINSSILKKYKFPLPKEEQIISFNSKVSLYIKEIKNLIIQTDKLKETKNKLLTKFFK